MRTRLPVAATIFTALLFLAAPTALLADFVRGDVNGDGFLDVADPVLTLGHLFTGAALGCADAADANDDGALDLGDPIRALAFLFSGGAPISSPFPGCGSDPTVDGLGCAVPLAGCTPPVQGLIFVGPNAQGYDEYELELDPTGVVDPVVLIQIPAGAFTMGQAGLSGVVTPVAVTLTSYLISKYEITNAQYQHYCDATGASEPTGPYCCDVPTDHFTNPSYADHPVLNVSWFDVSGFCAWAGLVLPTEAQWEYAARGSTGSTYPWGNAAPAVGAPPYRANYCPGLFPSCAGDGWLITSPVGAAPFDQFPGPFGTLDQAGNVWEWCKDWYGSYSPGPLANPAGPAGGAMRVLRGGSWNVAAFHLQSAYRNQNSPSLRDGRQGFRPAWVFP